MADLDVPQPGGEWRAGLGTSPTSAVTLLLCGPCLGGSTAPIAVFWACSALSRKSWRTCWRRSRWSWSSRASVDALVRRDMTDTSERASSSSMAMSLVTGCCWLALLERGWVLLTDGDGGSEEHTTREGRGRDGETTLLEKDGRPNEAAGWCWSCSGSGSGSGKRKGGSGPPASYSSINLLSWSEMVPPGSSSQSSRHHVRVYGGQYTFLAVDPGSLAVGKDEARKHSG